MQRAGGWKAANPVLELILPSHQESHDLLSDPGPYFSPCFSHHFFMEWGHQIEWLMKFSVDNYIAVMGTRPHIWWSLCHTSRKVPWLCWILSSLSLLFPLVSHHAQTFLFSLLGLEAEPTETLWEMLLGPRSITPSLPQWAGTIRSSTTSCLQSLSQPLDLRVLPSRVDLRQKANPPEYPLHLPLPFLSVIPHRSLIQYVSTADLGN